MQDVPAGSTVPWNSPFEPVHWAAFSLEIQEGWQLKEGRRHKECRSSQVSAVAGVALHFPGAARRLALLAGSGFGGALSVAPPGKIRQNESVCSKGRACG